MLEAKKGAWFERIFSIYNRNLLRRRFHSLHVSGLDYLRNKTPATSLIIYANHSSWWDGLVLFEILRRFDFENYIMMEEKQLRKLFLFRKLGAFSVIRENPREAVRSINYAARLLIENSNRIVIIFPQGEILPNDVRPLYFYNGLARIAEKVGKCELLPVALRFEFVGNFKPEIYVKISAPKIYESQETKKSTGNFSLQLTETLDVLKQEITAKKLSDYERIF